MTWGKDQKRPWTKEESERAAALYASRIGIRMVAKTMGRTRGSVQARYDAWGPTFAPPMHRAAHLIECIHRPSAELLAARDARAMLAPRSLTALICGDPLPGHSALERRR